MTDTHKEIRFHITARCVQCRYKWVMSTKQIQEAHELGCAVCSLCYSPATIEKAEKIDDAQ